MIYFYLYFIVLIDKKNIKFLIESKRINAPFFFLPIMCKDLSKRPIPSVNDIIFTGFELYIQLWRLAKNFS